MFVKLLINFILFILFYVIKIITAFAVYLNILLHNVIWFQNHSEKCSLGFP